MPALQVRDLPQGLYDALRYRAEQEHRSMAQETIVAIEQHLQSVPTPRAPARPLTEEEERQARIAKREALFAQIDRMPRIEIPDDFPSVVDIIHEAREERDARLGC